MTFVGAETTIIDQWIDAALKSGVSSVSNRVFEGLAPQPAEGQVEYPLCVYQCTPGIDATAINTAGTRILVNTEYIVRGISEGSFASLATTAAEIDAVLQGQIEEIVLSGMDPIGVVLGCTRQQQYRMVEQHEGRVIRHLGGVYSIVVTANEG